jgi:hypothetical protein
VTRRLTASDVILAVLLAVLFWWLTKPVKG